MQSMPNDGDDGDDGSNDVVGDDASCLVTPLTYDANNDQGSSGFSVSLGLSRSSACLASSSLSSIVLCPAKMASNPRS